MKRKFKKANKEEKVAFACCISYVPLLMGEPGVNLTPYGTRELSKELKDLFKQIEEVNNVVPGCLWVSYKEIKACPVFLLKRAKDIYDHIMLWSENKPEERFHLQYYVTKEKYGVRLFPDPKKSIARFKEAWLIRQGELIPPETEIKLISKPLEFDSKTPGFVAQHEMPKEVYLGFCDLDEIGDPTKLNEEVVQKLYPDFKWIGPFKTEKVDLKEEKRG